MLENVLGPNDVKADPTNYAQFLGTEFQNSGVTYRIVKAAEAITSAAKKILGEGSGNTVGLVHSAGNPAVGAVPSGIVTVSSTAAKIDQSSVFCVAVKGSVTVKISTAATLSANTLIAANTVGAAQILVAASQQVCCGFNETAITTATAGEGTVFLNC